MKKMNKGINKIRTVWSIIVVLRALLNQKFTEENSLQNSASGALLS